MLAVQLPHPPDGTPNECADAGRDVAFCCHSNDEYFCTPTDKAVATTFVAGMVQILMGVLNLGLVVDYIGHHVLNGFVTAAAITIFTSQIKHIFGLSHIRREWLGAVEDIAAKMGEARWQDVAMGTSAIAMTYALEKVKEKYTPIRGRSTRNYLCWLAGTARNALVVVAGLVVAAVVAATPEGTGFFKLVGKVPAGLPATVNPVGSMSASDYPEVVRASIVVALLGYLESVAIGKTFAQQNGCASQAVHFHPCRGSIRFRPPICAYAPCGPSPQHV